MISVPIPKKIRVGGFTYRIEQDNRATKELGRNNNYGDCQESSLLIRIAQDMLPAHRGHTFLHESLHVVNDIYNNHRMTEEEVHSMAHGLTQLFESAGVRFV